MRDQAGGPDGAEAVGMESTATEDKSYSVHKLADATGRELSKY